MFDSLISDLIECIEERHAAASYTRDPLKFCQSEEVEFMIGPRSLARTRSADADGPDFIVLNPSDYNPRDLFSIAHEMAHIISNREGYTDLIRHYHFPNIPHHLQRRHLEKIMDFGASRIIMTQDDLALASQKFGDSPRTILFCI